MLRPAVLLLPLLILAAALPDGARGQTAAPSPPAPRAAPAPAPAAGAAQGGSPRRPANATAAAQGRGTQARQNRGRQGRRAAGAAAAGVAAGAAAGAAAAAVAPAPAPEPPPPTTGQVTGLPLPRFAALRADEVNMRAGPGTRYPIEWTYQRKDLPVQIVREFELWRRIRDMEGTEGWVHQSNLTGRRNFVVAGEERVLRRRAEDNANPVARLRPGVIGRIRLCTAGQTWCEVQVGEHRGYLRRSEMFGVIGDEEIR
ncbi:SH3 domain-containing protein [Muricoccus radiodurans]|uniref:SH3 domain-containing protein n=1 Tax=Muricoccus radiodurans TaxID=2231721 RepID=UPI003CED233B